MPSDSTPAVDPPFAAILARMIALLDGRLTPRQREHLAAAMPDILWEFPDVDGRLHLRATAGGLEVAAAGAPPPFVVRMPRATLEDAAFGRRSLGAAFLAGKIHVRGMNPLRLREFIMLVDPLLDAYREAHREFIPASPPPVP
jgi:hypothetical protein